MSLQMCKMEAKTEALELSLLESGPRLAGPIGDNLWQRKCIFVDSIIIFY
jgi:hypothetical protein